MSTIKNPVGPQPPSVYWRRRLLLLLGVVAVIVVIVLIVVRPGAASGDGNGAKDPKGSTTSDVKGTPSDAASSKPGGTCPASSVSVVAITDAGTYAAGVQPNLSMSITNTGSTACTFDVGTAAQEYVITSGSDPIWNSKDCQTDPASSVQTLEPGKTLTTQPFPWDRTRSSTSTCSGQRPAVVGGGASYHLAVKLGTVTSKQTKQFILN